MSEESCCRLGHVPKVFSYVKDGKYVHTICKLKDNIDCFVLNEFFNMVYSIKLDNWNANFLYKNYSTGELINCFRSILEEKKIINLSDLCFLVVNNDGIVDYTLLEIIEKFLGMFDFIDEQFINLNNYDDIKLFVSNNDDFFYKEVESSFYNSIIVNTVSLDRSVKVRVRK